MNNVNGKTTMSVCGLINYQDLKVLISGASPKKFSDILEGVSETTVMTWYAGQYWLFKLIW